MQARVARACAHCSPGDANCFVAPQPRVGYCHALDTATHWILPRVPTRLVTPTNCSAAARVYAGWPDEVNSVRACVELTLQVYNSKLALPNRSVRQFAHTDGDWLAKGFGHIPAPQCAALTSPSHVGGERHYRFRFFDLSSDEVRRAERTHTRAGKRVQVAPLPPRSARRARLCRRRMSWSGYGALRGARLRRQRSQ